MKPLRCLTICFLTAVQEDVFKSSRILELCPKSGFEVVVLDPPWKSKNRGLWTSRVVGEREDIVFLIKFFIFLYFLVVFAWFTIMLYAPCENCLGRSDLYLITVTRSSQDAESVEKVDTVVGVHYNCCQSQQLLQLPMQKLFFAAERLRDMQLRWQSALGAICRRCTKRLQKFLPRAVLYSDLSRALIESMSNSGQSRETKRVI